MPASAFKLRTLHRWVSLTIATLWIVQALTGIVAVFHWEIDDSLIPSDERAVNFPAIEQRALTLSQQTLGGRVDSIWTTAAIPGRFDVYFEGGPNAPDQVVRIDGAGNILRVRSDGEMVANGGVINTLINVHHSLLLGDAGSWIIGLSGIFLMSNLLIGFTLAWPRRGRWKSALFPRPQAARIAQNYNWHRALGLWVAIPAMLIVMTGVTMAFEDGVRNSVNVAPVKMKAEVSTAPMRVGMARAVQTAQTRYPGADVSGIGFPADANPTWSIRLKQVDEPRRAYGKTKVHVSAIDGRIIDDYDALAAPREQRFFDTLFAFHTGEFGGLAGRIAVLGIGLWLVTMIVLGLRLWWLRR